MYKRQADALRWFLSNGSAPGQDVRFSYEKMDASWNFIDKIWNISRYILMNLSLIHIFGPGFDSVGVAVSKYLIIEVLEPADAWHIEHDLGDIPSDENNLLISCLLYTSRCV